MKDVLRFSVLLVAAYAAPSCPAFADPLVTQPALLAGASLAKREQLFSLKVFTSPDEQFWVNSIIIEGTREVMLVGAQLSRTGGENVLRQIQATQKPLSVIYITHEHADHFLGLEVFKEAYPSVRILANSNVVSRINKVYQDKIDKWKYLLTFDEELKKAKEPDELIKAMQERFPSSDLLLAIERGAKANVKHP
jgi:glyoxylase-like metal-dependent hydrolase (beta-lactamase superfamily II)